MPSYLYGCPECGATVTKQHSMYEDLTVKCSACYCVMIRKPQVNAVHFIGTGFASKEKA